MMIPCNDILTTINNIFFGMGQDAFGYSLGVLFKEGGYTVFITYKCVVMVVVPLRKKWRDLIYFFKDQKTLLKLGLPSKWPKKKSM